MRNRELSKTIDLSNTIAELRELQTLAANGLKDARYIDGDGVRCGVVQVRGDGITATVLAKDTLGAYEVARWDIAPGYRHDWHTHACAKMGSIINGDLTLRTARGEREMRQGDSFHVAEGEQHSVSSTTGSSVLVLLVTGHPAHGRFCDG